MSDIVRDIAATNLANELISFLKPYSDTWQVFQFLELDEDEDDDLIVLNQLLSQVSTISIQYSNLLIFLFSWRL